MTIIKPPKEFQKMQFEADELIKNAERDIAEEGLTHCPYCGADNSEPSHYPIARDRIIMMRRPIRGDLYVSRFQCNRCGAEWQSDPWRYIEQESWKYKLNGVLYVFLSFIVNHPILTMLIISILLLVLFHNKFES